ncbi:MAG: mandelate racemase/muconate lactonizing enzyme family protein [Hyphomicrobiaceae bacterium]
MRITAIRGVHVSIPLSVPYKLSRVYGTVSSADAVVVRLTTDTGLVGYGEADPHHPFTADTVEGTIQAIRDRLGPALIGSDPREIKRLEREMDDVLDGHLMAKGAIDMALFDLAGKSYGVPVHALLGGKLRERVLLSFPLGSGTAEEDMEVIEARTALGFRSFMAKMGRNPIPDEIKRVHKLSERYAGKVHLVADANQGWSEAEAVEFTAGVEGTFLELLEQPVPAGEHEALQRIRAKSTVPISADESVITAGDVLQLVARGAVDAYSVKASKNGGLTKAHRIVSIIEAAQLECRMNSMLEFGVTQAALLHLGAVTQRLIPSGHAYMSTLRMSADFTDFPKRLRDGYAYVSDAPGLGVSIDDGVLATHARSSFEVT